MFMVLSWLCVLVVDRCAFGAEPGDRVDRGFRRRTGDLTASLGRAYANPRVTLGTAA
jgi:hypothetical protein